MNQTKNSGFDPDKYIEEAKAAQEAQLIKEGKRPYLILSEGETTVTVDMQTPPREETGDFGKKLIFRVENNGKEHDLPCSMSLAKKILYQLKDKNNPMTLIRAGEGKQTRYSVKKPKKE